MDDLAARLARLPPGERSEILRLIQQAPASPVSAADPAAAPGPTAGQAEVTQAEYERLTEVLPPGPTVTIKQDTLDAAFARQVAATPHAIAIVDQAGSVTYRELADQAAQVAAALVRCGVGPGDFVPVCVRRGRGAVVAIFGVLLSGAAYVPLDESVPDERLREMLRGCRARVAVAAGRAAESLSSAGLEVTRTDSADRPQPDGQKVSSRAAPGDPAYVIYTSGSSGPPKGVVVSHRAVCHFSEAIVAEYCITADDTLMQFAPLTFDVSVFELFASLLAGARLVIVSDEDKLSPGRLTDLMRGHGVTVAELPPALMPLLDEAALPDLRLVSVGGEAFPGHLVATWRRPGRRFVNGYGPTECTVAVTLFECTGHWDAMPPIGRPLANHYAFVLDAELRPVPFGQPGELCVSGPQVAEGYLGQPELTAAYFPANPYRRGDFDARLYRTGDRVRWLPDGNLQFLGRVDRQVKLNGHRIEPAEIESAITSHPNIRQATVELIDLPFRGRTLVGYVVPIMGEADLGAGLRRHLAERLPAYLIPHTFVELPGLPLTRNGKVDKDALPLPAPSASGQPADVTAGDDALAAEIAATVIGPALAGGTLSPDDDFFHAGGDSLLAIKTVAIANSKYEVMVSVAAFLAVPTARNLAALIREKREQAAADRELLVSALSEIGDSP